MKIKKLPSGAYNVRKMVNGVSYSFTFDKKPTQSDILEELNKKISQHPYGSYDKMSFRQAANRFIESKKNVLSPNTIREYRSTCNRLSEWFVEKNIYEIDQISINKQVSELSAKLSPKTVRNYHGFISAILGTFRPDMNIYTTLPQKRSYEAYMPSSKDIKTILDYVKGTEYYVPFVLACYGLRRGEILAIDPQKDIEGDVLHINKAIAFTEDKEWVTKAPKTTESTRDIVIPLEIANEIKEKGYVFPYHPNKLSRRLNTIQDKLGIPRFGIHKMRHYFASALSSQGVPDADIMKLGGWKTDNVMKTVYRYSMLDKEEEKKRKTLEKFSKNILK